MTVAGVEVGVVDVAVILRLCFVAAVLVDADEDEKDL